MENLHKVAVKLGFLTKVDGKFAWGPLGCALRRNVITSCNGHSYRYTLYCITNAQSNNGTTLDEWFRRRELWWRQVTSIDDNVEFELSPDYKKTTFYKPFRLSESNENKEDVLEEIFSDSNGSIKCQWDVDRCIYALLHDSIIGETSQVPSGFRFHPSLAPYKVVTFNVCTKKVDESIAMCDRLRLSFNNAQIDNLYERLITPEHLDDRWRFYSNLGTCFAVIVDDDTLSDPNCVVRFRHSDSGIEEPTCVIHVRSKVLSNLGKQVIGRITAD